MIKDVQQQAHQNSLRSKNHRFYDIYFKVFYFYLNYYKLSNNLTKHEQELCQFYLRKLFLT